MQPHCLATFSDPRFSKVYFSKKTEIVNVREAVIDMAKTESLMMETTSSPRPYEANKSVEKDAFWGSFDKDDSISQANGTQSIDSEIALWSGISPLSWQSNPIHAMTGSKKIIPTYTNYFASFRFFPLHKTAMSACSA